MDRWQWFARRGRVPRRVWWFHYVVPSLLAPLVAAALDAILGLHPVALVDEGGAVVLGRLQLVVGLFMVVPCVSGAVARLHDRGHSAWWLLLLIPVFTLPVAFIAPVIAAVVLLVTLGVLPGQPHANEFGPVPAPMRWPRVPAALRPRGRSTEVAGQLLGVC